MEARAGTEVTAEPAEWAVAVEREALACRPMPAHRSPREVTAEWGELAGSVGQELAAMAAPRTRSLIGVSYRLKAEEALREWPVAAPARAEWPDF